MTKKTKTNSETTTDPGLPLIIVNPKSAGGSTRERWSSIAADLRSHFGPFTVAFTKAQGDGTALAEKFIKSGRRFILACGGDGTINEVVNGIVNSGEDVELGIMPAGTGGDFRKTIGLSTTAREAAKQLRDGKTKLIDLGKVTFLDHEGKEATRYFLNVASMGLSTSINKRVKSKGDYQWIPNEIIRGKTKFALSTIQEILENEKKTLRVSVDGGAEKTLNTINFCICNGRFFGGGMRIAPEAKLSDGFLDMVNIGDIKTARIILNGYKLYNGKIFDLKEVKSMLVSRIEVSAGVEGEIVEIETDGETPGRLPAIFEVVPKALKIRVPVL